ncbi:MAG: gamma-glutamyl-gamma-aminobutyrate hydrolase family protein [Tannerellaceae bacterium]|jgi:microsomal dipeptidase-like Zn-dependent dipeptidase/gamma-glutamyl-gamma-aminobutyrate hydrolase PuuD|nr:gamma-glutamyl-gamma-aminobutyrate hydrolase family protein [Tannerellaceae bacterium]
MSPSAPLRIPRIGISANHKDNTSCIAEAYVRSVLIAGGAPVLVPVIDDPEALSVIVDSLDGLLLSGGGDIDPHYLGEEPHPLLDGVDSGRDKYELALLRLSFDRGLPVFGICRGHQLINIAFGGTIYQDVHSQHKGAITHSQAGPRELPSHSVVLSDAPSRLRSILKVDTLPVNSIHHQAVWDIAGGFISTATSTDGVNEAIEHPSYPILSVQWHPEAMASAGDNTMAQLFFHHIKEASLFARAKDLHSRSLTIDMHTDTPMAYNGPFDLGVRPGGVLNHPFTETRVSLPLMEDGRLDAAFMVAYIPQGALTEEGRRDAFNYTLDRLGQVRRQADLYPDRVGIASSADDLLSLKHKGRKALVPGVENGYAIGLDLDRLSKLKQLGVCYITLCHNGHNDICDSSSGEPRPSGLSPFGVEVVGRMNDLGIMIDVSHSSEKTFYDVLRVSRCPVIASHSSARALCDHPRNLTDMQIAGLAGQGGIINICLYAGFLRQDGTGEATLTDAVNHISHIVDLVGIDHVGIGSDFDGGGGIEGCRACNELIHLTTRLFDKGYSEEDIAKIWGGNLLRVMAAVQSAAH